MFVWVREVIPVFVKSNDNRGSLISVGPVGSLMNIYLEFRKRIETAEFALEEFQQLLFLLR